MVRTDGADGTDVGSTVGATVVVVTAGASAAGAAEVVGAEDVRGAADVEAGEDSVAGAGALVVGSALLDGVGAVVDDGGVDGWLVVGCDVGFSDGDVGDVDVSEPGLGSVGEVEGPVVDVEGDVGVVSPGVDGDCGVVVTVTSGSTTGGASGGTVAFGSRFSTLTDSCCHWSTSSCLRCSSPTVATVVVMVCSFCWACSHCPSSIIC